jgi:ubiquinone/menaquinone biosynthesis C-methylase UbiE
MTKSRVPETDHGIQGEVTVSQYNQMQQNFREKGWLETKALIDSGISTGLALEIGHGPGYLGLEWLKSTVGTRLTGLDISPDMQALAVHNAEDYSLSDRTRYQLGNGDHLPFEDGSFDAVFTNGSLHEWVNPVDTFNEIWRVLKQGGHYFISDLHRDMNPFMQVFLWLGVRPTTMRSGLVSSIAAAYTSDEIHAILKNTKLKGADIQFNAIDLQITGIKKQEG